MSGVPHPAIAPRKNGAALWHGVVFLTRLLVVDGEGLLLRRRAKAAFDAVGWRQLLIAETFPALLRVMNRDDRPAISRWPGRVENLPLWQAAVARVRGRDRRLVLLLRPSRKLMHDAVGHTTLLSRMSKAGL